MERILTEEPWTRETNSLTHTALATAETLEQLATSENIRKRMNLAVECKELMMLYACAIKEMQIRFEILNTEYGVHRRRNPIQSITSRLKSSASIVAKLNQKGIAFSPGNIEKYIKDVAGIRVICNYMDDIFTLAEAISHQEGVELVEMKDYITHPKPNGYRSLHLILNVPVCFSTYVKQVKVEVQIRTIAMDCWASLEHQLKYKHHIPDEQEVISQLCQCAETMAETDALMQKLRMCIDGADHLSEDEILLEKIKKMDWPLA